MPHPGTMHWRLPRAVATSSSARAKAKAKTEARASGCRGVVAVCAELPPFAALLSPRPRAPALPPAPPAPPLAWPLRTDEVLAAPLLPPIPPSPAALAVPPVLAADAAGIIAGYAARQTGGCLGYAN